MSSAPNLEHSMVQEILYAWEKNEQKMLQEDFLENEIIMIWYLE